VTSVALSPDGTKIISGSLDFTIRIWEVPALVLEISGNEDGVTSVAFSPDGNQIASDSDDMTARVWNATIGDENMPPLRGHEGCVESVAFSPDSAKIVSGTEDATIRVWHAGSGKEFLQMRGHKAGVVSLVCSVDGRRIVSGSWDSTVRVWDVTTDMPRYSLNFVGILPGLFLCPFPRIPIASYLSPGMKVMGRGNRRADLFD
jgi:WD40 repeat protein